MPWVPIKGALKTAREAAELTQLQLAIRANVSERTVKQLESTKPPAVMSTRVYGALSKVLRKPIVPFARFVPSGGDPEPPPPAAKPAARDDKLPARSTVSLRAEQERTLGLHDLKVRTLRGELPLLGLTWFKLVWSRPTKYDGMRFVVIGSVDDHQGLNPSIRKKFRLDDGGKYRVVRWLDGDTPFYATVFAFTSAHADALTPVAQAQGDAAMIVRVQHAPLSGAWKGFTFFGKERTNHEFAFVCDEILAELPALVAQGPRAR